MPIITLPDGSTKEFDKPVTGLEVAESIGSGLLKAAVAMEINGETMDLSNTITTDSNMKIFTAKTDKGLEVLRHSTAHILAQAIKNLYPSAQITIGPVIENGFYYDVDFSEKSISSDNLGKIEAEMKAIIKADLPISRHIWSREEAIKYFKNINENYKAELISDLPKTETISVYKQGEGDSAFFDLCRGPHVPSTSKIGRKTFKLTSVAGAYWRGNSDNTMLTRIYGTAWATDKELKQHLRMLEEAAKRDHRKIGPAMDLFHLQDCAPGQVFWHHKGWFLYRTLENYMRDKCFEHNYTEVNTPQVMDVEIWKTSGHWDKFRDDMMTHDDGDRTFGLKPMSCPGDIQIYNNKLHSYRDLPIRMAEFGRVFRNEASGAVHGIMRVKAFTQDDAHIFCTESQMEDEIVAMVEILREVYTDFGFGDFKVKFSDRPEKRLGTDEIWDKSEAALKSSCKKLGLEYTLNPGEGAFYGPKLEFVLKDCLGRDWQCGTIQLDLNMPERFNMEYVGEDGKKHRPIMIHRAILGSLERFMGILIENFAGHFPLWFAPVQIVAMGITDKQNPHIEKLVKRLKDAGLRIEGDYRNEKINYKIREHSHQKVPVILVVGDREIENDSVTVRRLGSQKQTTMQINDLIATLLDEITTKQLPIIENNDDKAA